jgi:hypothetical protein
MLRTRLLFFHLYENETRFSILDEKAEKEIRLCDTTFMFYLIKQTQSNSAYGALDLFTCLRGAAARNIKAPAKVTFGSSLKIKCWLSADAVNKGNGVESEGGKTRTLVCACRVRELRVRHRIQGVRVRAGAENRACIFDFNTLSGDRKVASES